jgi:hypothetical protein
MPEKSTPGTRRTDVVATRYFSALARDRTPDSPHSLRFRYTSGNSSCRICHSCSLFYVAVCVARVSCVISQRLISCIFYIVSTQCPRLTPSHCVSDLLFKGVLWLRWLDASTLPRGPRSFLGQHFFFIIYTKLTAEDCSRKKEWRLKCLPLEEEHKKRKPNNRNA